MRTFGYKSKAKGLFRAIAAIVIGLVMVTVQVNALNVFLQYLGALIALRGIIGFIVLCFQKDDSDFMGSAVNSVLNAVLGGVMFLYPEWFVNILMYMVAVLMIALGFVQLLAMMSASRVINVGFFSFVLPLLIILLGILLIVRPSFLGEMIGIVAGVSLMVYGVSELLSLRKMKKAIDEYDIKFPSEKQQQNPDDVHQIKDVDYEKVDEQ